MGQAGDLKSYGTQTPAASASASTLPRTAPFTSREEFWLDTSYHLEYIALKAFSVGDLAKCDSGAIESKFCLCLKVSPLDISR